MTTLDPTAAVGRRPQPASSWTETRRTSQDQREAIVLAVLVVCGLAIIGIWWADTPGRSLHTAADRLTAAGRITGLLGTYLVLVQVVLMARLPWLDRFIGTDRLSAWHRSNGGYTITLLVAHAWLTVWGYAAAGHKGVAHETVTVLQYYPDVLAATAALAVLVAIGITSARAAQRRLKHETWYLLHLYTYLAIALSFSHQLATGNDFVTHPANRVLWAVLFVAAFGLLVVFRILVPMRDIWKHQLRVSAVQPEGSGAVSVYFTGRDLDRMRARAGQFFRWRFLTRDGWWQSHPFSLSADPGGGALRITAKAVGDHSRSLSHLRPGTRVIAEGPYGNFTAARRTRRKVLLIAGGVGITPLRALMEEMPAGPGDIVLVYRASNERAVLFRSELDVLAQQKGVVVHYVLGRREKNPRALSPARLRGMVPDVQERDAFVCGPAGMMDAATGSLRALGLGRDQIHRERFEL